MVTDLIKVGLNHIMFLRLRLRGLVVVLAVVGSWLVGGSAVNPLVFSASMYTPKWVIIDSLITVSCLMNSPGHLRLLGHILEEGSSVRIIAVNVDRSVIRFSVRMVSIGLEVF